MAAAPDASCTTAEKNLRQKWRANPWLVLVPAIPTWPAAFCWSVICSTRSFVDNPRNATCQAGASTPILRHMANYENNLQSIAQTGLALSDPGRLRVLMALDGRSLCVCQLTQLLGLAPSTVSKHLSVLKQAGLIKEKKIARWVYHELCDCDCDCRPAIDWVGSNSPAMSRLHRIALP